MYYELCSSVRVEGCFWYLIYLIRLERDAASMSSSVQSVMRVDGVPVIRRHVYGPTYRVIELLRCGEASQFFETMNFIFPI